MNGIVTLPIVPLRETGSEQSEMTSQLLFGELVEVIDVHERWLYLRNCTDDYTGWADRKMIQILTEEEYLRLTNAARYCVTLPLLHCDKIMSKQKLLLPGGSFLPAFAFGRCTIADEIYQISLPEVPFIKESISDKIVDLATQYLNTPYLWGGKTVLGIDCSGLVQVIFAMIGLQLPRDASRQVEFGQVIDFLFEVKAGDLAFFENSEGKIIHVGILLNAHQIIHASGWVKIDSIDSQGIISAQTGEYTHILRVIKRLI